MLRKRGGQTSEIRKFVSTFQCRCQKSEFEILLIRDLKLKVTQSLLTKRSRCIFIIVVAKSCN